MENRITLLTPELFERMYLDMINDKSFVQRIIDTNQFHDWIHNDATNNPTIHLHTLEALKNKLIEFEFYEYIKEVDELIFTLQVKLNIL